MSVILKRGYIFKMHLKTCEINSLWPNINLHFITGTMIIAVRNVNVCSVFFFFIFRTHFEPKFFYLVAIFNGHSIVNDLPGDLSALAVNV